MGQNTTVRVTMGEKEYAVVLDEQQRAIYVDGAFVAEGYRYYRPKSRFNGWNVISPATNRTRHFTDLTLFGRFMVHMYKDQMKASRLL